MSVAVSGVGEPVLALHGLTANRAVWKPLADRLPAGRALVAPDLPARGRSPPASSGRYRLHDELRRLRSLIDESGTRPDVVVGHSQGAALAVALASTDPAVRCLVLSNPVCPWTSRPPFLDWLPGAAPVVRRSLAALRGPIARWVLRHRVYADPTRADREAADRYAAPWSSPSRAAELPRILADWNPSELWPYVPPPPMPIRVLAAAGDRRVPVADAARLSRVCDGRLRVVAGAAHGLPEERPDAVAEAVAAACEEADAGREPETG